jgi:hypothetical protein
MRKKEVKLTRAEKKAERKREKKAKALGRKAYRSFILMLMLWAALLVVAYTNPGLIPDSLFPISVELLCIGVAIAAMKFAYRRGFRLSTLLYPLTNGITILLIFMIVMLANGSTDAFGNMNMLYTVVMLGSAPAAVGVVVGWIGRLIFKPHKKKKK